MVEQRADAGVRGVAFGPNLGSVDFAELFVRPDDTWFVVVTTDAWLRADEKTQKEHRLIAEQVRETLCERFPDLRDVIMGDEDKAAA